MAKLVNQITRVEVSLDIGLPRATLI